MHLVVVVKKEPSPSYYPFPELPAEIVMPLQKSRHRRLGRFAVITNYHSAWLKAYLFPCPMSSTGYHQRTILLVLPPWLHLPS